ncbi:MAG: RrF2 family transcriptional regulator [Pseudanabaenaceae cyanobacterium]
MRLTKRGQYALKAMLDLALQGGKLTSVRQIAHRQEIPLPFLEKILLELRQAGLVTAQRGSKGGYTLGKSAKEISIRDILGAIGEGMTTPESPEPLDMILNRRIHERIQDILQQISLAELYYDLISQQAQSEATFIV